MSQVFRPSLRKDGTFDPDCLEQAGQNWVTTWLKARLSGHDPYFPIDKRGDEAPSGLIVDILEGAGSAHPSHGLIAQGILDLLDEARKQAPETPPYLEPVLEICERARLPWTGSWFTEELRSLAADPQAAEERWGDRLVKEILHGAVLQSPGFPATASHAIWRAILKVPRYATLAWMGLAPSFVESLDYMEDWWQTCPPRRQAEIDQFVFTGLKTEGRAKVREFLRRRSRSWSAAIKAAVDSALRNNGVAEVFESREEGPRSNSVAGAARNRETVLQEQREAA